MHVLGKLGETENTVRNSHAESSRPGERAQCHEPNG